MVLRRKGRRSPPAATPASGQAGACVLSSGVRAGGALLILALLVSTPFSSFAEEQDPSVVPPPIEDPPRRAIRLASDGGQANVLIPLIEVPALNVAIWGVNRLRGEPWANISLSSMWANIQGPWEWDDDGFVVNGFSHPYHGSLAFSSARSSGLGFWTSIPFAFGSSLMWEVLMETEPPSKNDLIATTLGGIVLGEMLHRLSLLVLDGGEPSVARSVLAFFVDPVGNLNYFLFGRRENAFFPHSSLFVRGLGGMTTHLVDYTSEGGVREERETGLQALVGFDVEQGLPGDDVPLQRPFDHFLARGRFWAFTDPQMAITLSGLLFGGRFEAGSTKGLWGLATHYDFLGISAQRVTTVGLGLSGSAQVPLWRGAYFLPAAMVSGLPYAAGGIIPPVGNRDYLRGPGVQGRLGLRFVAPGWTSFQLESALYSFSGAYTGTGIHTTWYGTASLDFIAGRFGALGLASSIAVGGTRASDAFDDNFQRAITLSVVWSFINDPGFGAVVPIR